MDPQVGIALSGLTGSGKSTLQAQLLAGGCWSPRLHTSRPVGREEGDSTAHVERETLIEGVRSGDFVAPLLFAGEIYTWSKQDFDRLRAMPAGVVLNARPYTALLMSMVTPGLVPVWLDLDEDTRRERLKRRGEVRDTDVLQVARRREQDDEDVSYRDLFAVQIRSDDSALDALTTLVEGKRLA
jgi:guanylate kinase